MQVSVKNQFFRFHFDAVDFAGDPDGNGRNRFTVKIPRERITKAINPGMECAVLKDKNAFIKGIINKIKPGKRCLVLECSFKGGKT